MKKSTKLKLPPLKEKDMTARAFAIYRNAVRFVHDTSGNAILELAIIVPLFLAPLMLGAYDFSMAFIHKLRLEQAARAGGQVALKWGMHSAGATVKGYIAQGVRNDYENGNTTLPVTVTFVCSCLDGTPVTDCPTARCATPGEVPKRRIDITTTTVHPLIVDWPGIGGTVSLTGDDIVRIR